MILPNGYIETETTTGGGMDSKGHAIGCVVTFTNKTHCQYIKRENLQQRTEDEPTASSSFDIYIDNNGMSFEAERIRLSTKNGVVIGRYAVRSITELEAVGQYLITV